jgi:hypothetical protein
MDEARDNLSEPVVLVTFVIPIGKKVVVRSIRQHICV